MRFTQLASATSNYSIIFHIDTKLFGSSAGTSVICEILTYTAELIESHTHDRVGLYLIQPLTERFSVTALIIISSSDSDHANELQLVTPYAILLAPRITIGHRFRLVDFHTQSGSGYFDTNNYIANRAFSALYHENRFFYTYLEGYVGYQTFRRNGIASDALIHGGSGSIGIKPIANLAIEVNAEGGNFSAGATSGFDYFIIGPRLVYRF